MGSAPRHHRGEERMAAEGLADATHMWPGFWGGEGLWLCDVNMEQQREARSRVGGEACTPRR